MRDPPDIASEPMCRIRTNEGAPVPLLMFPLQGAIVSGVFATCIKRAVAPRI